MRHFDLVIIGSGSGNSLPDRRFAHFQVAVIEEGVFGGTCLNVGCIPTKMFVYAANMARSARDSARYGVDASVDKVRWAGIRDRVSAGSTRSPRAAGATAPTGLPSGSPPTGS